MSNGRSLLIRLALFWFMAVSSALAEPATQWLRLEQLDRQQQRSLEAGQRGETRRLDPVPAWLPQRQLQQRRQLRSLQDRQRRFEAVRRQQAPAAAASGGRSGDQIQIQRFRRRQQGLQNNLQQQRWHWGYRH